MDKTHATTNLKTEYKVAPIGDSWKLLYENKSDLCYFKVTEWKEIVNFDEYDLPEFDLSIFPQMLQDFILAASKFTQTPVDLSAFCAIGTLSVSLQKKFEVEAVNGWKEPLNTYTVALMGSSSRKSAVFKLFTDPIFKYQQELEKEYDKQSKENGLKISLIDKQIEKLKNDYVKNNSPQTLNRLKELESEKSELDVGYKPVLILDNVTEEKLISTLFENNEKVSIITDEGDLFERLKSSVKLDSHKTDVYLKGYSCNALRVDRISRGTEMLYSPTLTVCISAQPTVLEAMPRKLINRGLIPRFLVSIPRDNLGNRDVFNAPPLTQDLKDLYADFIEKLLEFECSEPITLKLSDEAFNLMKQHEYEIEKLFLRDQLYHEELRGWGGKILGNLLRLTGIIHVANHAQNTNNLSEIPQVIEVETLQNVFKLKNYFDNHIQKAFGIMNANTFYEDTRYLLQKVLNLVHEKECYTVDKQDVWQKTRSRFIIASELNNALTALVDRGYLQIRFGGPSGKKEIVIVNPTALDVYFKINNEQAIK